MSGPGLQSKGFEVSGLTFQVLGSKYRVQGLEGLGLGGYRV